MAGGKGARGNLRAAIPEDCPPTKAVLGLHKELRKAESALLVQMRTGHIGFAKYLQKRGVPGYESPNCQCQQGHETPRHIALYCTIDPSLRNKLKDAKGRFIPYPQLIGTNLGAKKATKWLMRTGRLGQFALAQRLLYST